MSKGVDFRKILVIFISLILMVNVTGCGTDEALLESAYQKALSEGTSQNEDEEKEKNTTEKEITTRIEKEETTTRKVEVTTEETEYEEVYEYEQKKYKDTVTLSIPKDWREHESDSGVVWGENSSEYFESVTVIIQNQMWTMEQCKTWSDTLGDDYSVSYEGERECADKWAYVIDTKKNEENKYQRWILIPLDDSMLTLVFTSWYEKFDFVEPFDTVYNSIQIDEKKKTDDSNVIEPGMYKVGKDIKVGTYILFNAQASRDAYMCVSSDANQEDIIFNENFGNNLIIKVKKGEYLELSGCLAVSFKRLTRSEESIKKVIDMMNDRIDEGAMYLVGTTLEPGEYKLKRSDDSLGGYYCIYRDARHDNIVSNDYFDRNSTYVNVKKGDYLLLSNCKIVK